MVYQPEPSGHEGIPLCQHPFICRLTPTHAGPLAPPDRHACARAECHSHTHTTPHRSACNTSTRGQSCGNWPGLRGSQGPQRLQPQGNQCTGFTHRGPSDYREQHSLKVTSALGLHTEGPVGLRGTAHLQLGVNKPK